MYSCVGLHGVIPGDGFFFLHLVLTPKNKKPNVTTNATLLRKSRQIVS
jgi:hypothetical protein